MRRHNPDEDITVNVEASSQLDVDRAALAKACTWYDATRTGLLPDGRQLRVKHTDAPEAAVTQMDGTVSLWRVDVTVGPDSEVAS